MLLKKKGELLSDEKQLASIINTFFINITKSLNLKEDQGSPLVILNDILKKKIFTRVLIRLEKLMKTTKSSFPTYNRRTRRKSYFKY